MRIINWGIPFLNHNIAEKMYYLYVYTSDKPMKSLKVGRIFLLMKMMNQKPILRRCFVEKD